MEPKQVGYDNDLNQTNCVNRIEPKPNRIDTQRGCDQNANITTWNRMGTSGGQQSWKTLYNNRTRKETQCNNKINRSNGKIRWNITNNTK